MYTPEQARRAYQLTPAGGRLFATDLDNQLLEQGIAQIDMPLGEGDLSSLTAGLDACIDACPELLPDTFHVIDSRLDNSAGYVRKERKINRAGKQIEDPKSLIHFTETARERWLNQFAHGPKVLRDFLHHGFEVQYALLDVMRDKVAELEPTHANISKLYFSPERPPETLSFLRVLSYDGYEVTGRETAVAKPHYDRGGITIQAYADAPGFWASVDGPSGERTHYDTDAGKAYLFLGTEHDKVYGADSPLKPLWHGVDRVIPEAANYVTKRHAVILFTDAPHVNHGITAQDTLPYIHPVSNNPQPELAKPEQIEKLA